MGVKYCKHGHLGEEFLSFFYILSFCRFSERGNLLTKMAAQAPDGNESLLIVLSVTAQQFSRDRLYRHANLNQILSLVQCFLET